MHVTWRVADMASSQSLHTLEHIQVEWSFRMPILLSQISLPFRPRYVSETCLPSWKHAKAHHSLRLHGRHKTVEEEHGTWCSEVLVAKRQGLHPAANDRKHKRPGCDQDSSELPITSVQATATVQWWRQASLVPFKHGYSDSSRSDHGFLRGPWEDARPGSYTRIFPHCSWPADCRKDWSPKLDCCLTPDWIRHPYDWEWSCPREPSTTNCVFIFPEAHALLLPSVCSLQSSKLNHGRLRSRFWLNLKQMVTNSDNATSSATL